MRDEGTCTGFASLVMASLIFLMVGTGYTQEVMGEITASAPSEGVVFSYQGDTGPEFWGTLSPEWEACGTGMEQSPIDITSMTISGSDPAVLDFNYNPTPFTILNNGHTIEVMYTPGSTLVVQGETFEVKQFHFHISSRKRDRDQQRFPHPSAFPSAARCPSRKIRATFCILFSVTASNKQIEELKII